MKRLLFYRRGGLGDTLLTFPVLEYLKKEGYHITVIGRPEYFEIAKYIGWVDEIYSDFYPQVLQREYHKKVLFSKLNGIDPFPAKRMWIVDYYFEVLNLKKDFSLFLPIKPMKNSPLKDKAVLHPGSGSLKKVPDLRVFKKIEDFFKKQGMETIYLVGEADKWIKEITSNYWVCTEPLSMAKALKSAGLFIGVDSGVSHLASYLGIKTFVFFGPTDQIMWRPIGKNYQIISLELECSPCFPNVCKQRPCLDSEKLFNKLLKFF